LIQHCGAGYRGLGCRIQGYNITGIQMFRVQDTGGIILQGYKCLGYRIQGYNITRIKMFRVQDTGV